jgi:hypothetical protein
MGYSHKFQFGDIAGFEGHLLLSLKGKLPRDSWISESFPLYKMDMCFPIIGVLLTFIQFEFESQKLDENVDNAQGKIDYLKARGLDYLIKLVSLLKCPPIATFMSLIHSFIGEFEFTLDRYASFEDLMVIYERVLRNYLHSLSDLVQEAQASRTAEAEIFSEENRFMTCSSFTTIIYTNSIVSNNHGIFQDLARILLSKFFSRRLRTMILYPSTLTSVLCSEPVSNINIPMFLRPHQILHGLYLNCVPCLVQERMSLTNVRKIYQMINQNESQISTYFEEFLTINNSQVRDTFLSVLMNPPKIAIALSNDPPKSMFTDNCCDGLFDKSALNAGKLTLCSTSSYRESKEELEHYIYESILKSMSRSEIMLTTFMTEQLITRIRSIRDKMSKSGNLLVPQETSKRFKNFESSAIDIREDELQENDLLIPLYDHPQSVRYLVTYDVASASYTFTPVIGPTWFMPNAL